MNLLVSRAEYLKVTAALVTTAFAFLAGYGLLKKETERIGPRIIVKLRAQNAMTEKPTESERRAGERFRIRIKEHVLDSAETKAGEKMKICALCGAPTPLTVDICYRCG
jgi:hypothetical protein